MERHALLAHPPSSDRPLGIPGFRYSDLHDPARLADLTAAFDGFLRSADEPLFSRYDAHRGGPRLRGAEESELLLQVSAYVSRFVARLFEVEADFTALREAAGRDAPIFRVKREFVQRRVFRKGAKDRPHAGDFAALDARVQPLLTAAGSVDERDRELQVAQLIAALRDAGRASPGSRELPAWQELRGRLQRALPNGPELEP